MVEENQQEEIFDIAEHARKTAEADETLERILAKEYYNFNQYAETDTITDLGVAKIIIKRLLDKVQQLMADGKAEVKE